MTDYFKIRVWAVIGEASTGKSSIVRNLASIKQTYKPRKDEDTILPGGSGHTSHIMLRGGGFIEMYASSQSLQEAGKSPSNFITKHLQKAREKQSQRIYQYYNILIALRAENGISKLPSADQYLIEFIKVNWEIQSLILLQGLESSTAEFKKYAHFGAPLCEIENSTEFLQDEPKRNWVFGQARNHFGWA